MTQTADRDNERTSFGKGSKSRSRLGKQSAAFHLDSFSGQITSLRRECMTSQGLPASTSSDCEVLVAMLLFPR